MSISSIRAAAKARLSAAFEALRAAGRTMFGSKPNRNQQRVLQALEDGAQFPANYPNRAVRRAVKHNKPSRLPVAWREYLAAKPEFREAIRRA